MPSHAKTTNSQSSSTVNCCTSGNATNSKSFHANVQSKAAYLGVSLLPVTICSCGGLRSFRLNIKSPRARDSARLPFTLLYSTKPPAASIRLRSSFNVGLWSRLRGTALPLIHATALLSPALAYKLFY